MAIAFAILVSTVSASQAVSVNSNRIVEQQPSVSAVWKEFKKH